VLREVSLPAAVSARLPTLGPRPLDLRPATTIAAMADDAATLVAQSAGADALIISLNPAWQHWDRVSCDGIQPPHSRYHCLQTPQSAAVDDARAAEMKSLIDAVIASDVPCYLYTIPHSTTALNDPLIADQIASAEAWFASFDPGISRIRIVSESFSRHIPDLQEGTEFHDMVHPTWAGAELLSDWLATDLAAFFARFDLDPC